MKPTYCHISLWELFENSELVKNTWINDYQFINVQNISDEKLKEKDWSGILQFFLNISTNESY
ncbi:hypothetical protein GCO76_00705 [Rickettsia sp. R2]